MGLLTKNEEYLSRMRAAPHSLKLIMERVSANYKYYDLQILLRALSDAEKIVQDVKRSVIYFRNTEQK